MSRPDRWFFEDPHLWAEMAHADPVYAWPFLRGFVDFWQPVARETLAVMFLWLNDGWLERPNRVPPCIGRWSEEELSQRVHDTVIYSFLRGAAVASRMTRRDLREHVTCVHARVTVAAYRYREFQNDLEEDRICEVCVQRVLASRRVRRGEASALRWVYSAHLEPGSCRRHFDRINSQVTARGAMTGRLELSDIVSRPVSRSLEAYGEISAGSMVPPIAAAAAVLSLRLVIPASPPLVSARVAQPDPVVEQGEVYQVPILSEDSKPSPPPRQDQPPSPESSPAPRALTSPTAPGGPPLIPMSPAAPGGQPVGPTDGGSEGGEGPSSGDPPPSPPVPPPEPPGSRQNTSAAPHSGVQERPKERIAGAPAPGADAGAGGGSGAGSAPGEE